MTKEEKNIIKDLIEELENKSNNMLVVRSIREEAEERVKVLKKYFKI